MDYDPTCARLIFERLVFDMPMDIQNRVFQNTVFHNTFMHFIWLRPRFCSPSTAEACQYHANAMDNTGGRRPSAAAPCVVNKIGMVLACLGRGRTAESWAQPYKCMNVL